mmetsp:Transcript_13837/g.20206  ORF Transcript_13837/g.20206 Transcript_13837/m.20206 type:complete len:204 (+) Transcript_13837:32-643(+)
MFRYSKPSNLLRTDSDNGTKLKMFCVPFYKQNSQRLSERQNKDNNKFYQAMYQLGNECVQELHCEMQKLRSIKLYRPPEESDYALHDMDRRLKASLLGNIDESRKPSQTEIEQYDESIIYRTQFLSRIKIAELIGDYRFEHVFKDLYNDVKRFEYAWFCIIFKRKECLTYSQQAIRVLKSLAEMQPEKFQKSLTMRFMTWTDD